MGENELGPVHTIFLLFWQLYFCINFSTCRYILHMNKRFFTALALVLLLQSSAVFAEAPPQDFFENAWQEAQSATDYGFSCTKAVSGIKISKNKLTDNQRKSVDFMAVAFKRYRDAIKGAIIGGSKKISIVQEGVNTMKIDTTTPGGGKLTVEEAMIAIKKTPKKKISMIIIGNQIYYKDNAWKTFEHPELAANIFGGAEKDGLTSDFQKDSFVYHSGEGMGSSEPTVYSGKYTAEQNIEFLTPFVGEDSASQQQTADVKLFIDGKGHFKKTVVTAKPGPILGGLTFTVKHTCQISMAKTPKITVPKDAVAIDRDAGIQEIVKLSP